MMRLWRWWRAWRTRARVARDGRPDTRDWLADEWGGTDFKDGDL